GFRAELLNGSRRFEPLTEIRLSRKAQKVGSAQAVDALIRASRAARRKLRGRRSNIEFHIEHLPLRQLTRGGTVVLVPHPEWFLELDEWKLQFVSMVACKSRHAVEIFSRAGLQTFLMGFTSIDRGNTG